MVRKLSALCTGRVLLPRNPTQQYQKKIKQTLKQCSNIIPKENAWRYTNINPIAPALHATIKLHKPNKPIRPIINWNGTPAYGTAKELTKALQKHLQLPHAYNIRNSKHLMTELKNVIINEDTRLC
jgi:hypothetical protein